MNIQTIVESAFINELQKLSFDNQYYSQEKNKIFNVIGTNKDPKYRFPGKKGFTKSAPNEDYWEQKTALKPKTKEYQQATEYLKKYK